MSERIKKVFIVLLILAGLLVIAGIFQTGVIPSFAMQADSILHAGTWENDPKNWYPAAARSFRTENYSGDTPAWFAPDPVARYDVWDQAVILARSG